MYNEKSYALEVENCTFRMVDSFPVSVGVEVNGNDSHREIQQRLVDMSNPSYPVSLKVNPSDQGRVLGGGAVTPGRNSKRTIMFSHVFFFFFQEVL